MKQSLREAGWHTVEALGVPDHPDWSAEQSVLIPGIGQQEAVTLGRCWQQNAIVFGRSGEPPASIGLAGDGSSSTAIAGCRCFRRSHTWEKVFSNAEADRKLAETVAAR